MKPSAETTAESREPIEYFAVCARQQDPEKNTDQSHGICNNSDSHHVDDRLAWWDRDLLRRYLRTKFAFLASLQREEEMDLLELARRLEVDASREEEFGLLEEIEETWRRTEPVETQALLLRLEQLPDDVVIEEWYVACEELDEWRMAAIESQRALAHQIWRDVRGGYPALQQEAVDEGHGGAGDAARHERQVVAAMVQSGAAGVVSAVAEHLLGFGELPPGIGIDLRPEGDIVLRAPADLPSAFESASAGSLTARISAETFGTEPAAADPEQLMESFTIAVANVADCALCDLLVWDGKLLQPRAISDPSTDLLRINEPYGWAEGISGSVVLVPHDAPRRWVGTNDLAGDPRASKKHADAWKEGGGELTDYWLIPLFSGEELFGAIRVINRNRARYVAGVPWTRAILRELQGVAGWFEANLLPLVADAARRRSPKPLRQRSDPGNAGAIQRLRADCRLDWIDPAFFAGLIQHMCSVAFRKVEKTSLGCCIGVFGEREIDPLLDLLPYYKAVDRVKPDGLDAAGALYSRVSPTAGMFLFDQAGNGCGAVSLASEGLGIKGAKALTDTRPQSVVLFLDRGQDCVRIITGGEVAADYYLSDATGNWMPRIYEPWIPQVVEAAPPGFAGVSVEKVFRLAADLSYMRIGSMIILAEELPDHVHVSGGEERVNLFLDNLTAEVEFADLARIDGAMQIDSAGAIVRCGAIVRPNTEMAQVPDTLGTAGSRHRAAEDFSRLAEEHALVIVVSENRPLTVFSAGKRVVDKL
jgi:hypothetical protein